MRKIIIRADDIGYSEVNDMGAFEALENGVATVADVMLDAPHAPQALTKLHDMPWISVGWHAHFWMSPVLPAEKVPTLVQPNGRFRTDLHEAKDVSYDEMMAECKAQIEMCIDTLGRVPDTGVGMRGDSPFSRALADTSALYGMPVNYMGFVRDGKTVFPNETWAGRKIVMSDLMKAYDPLFTTDIDKLAEAYDPIRYYLKDEGGLFALPEDVISMCCWHPGYLDWTNFREGDYGPNARFFTTCRIVDVHALCSDELKAWIRENRIELVNFRDALYGTRSYQNHLRRIGSDLAVD